MGAAGACGGAGAGARSVGGGSLEQAAATNAKNAISLRIVIDMTESYSDYRFDSENREGKPNDRTIEQPSNRRRTFV